MTSSNETNGPLDLVKVIALSICFLMNKKFDNRIFRPTTPYRVAV